MHILSGPSTYSWCSEMLLIWVMITVDKCSLQPFMLGAEAQTIFDTYTSCFHVFRSFRRVNNSSGCNVLDFDEFMWALGTVSTATRVCAGRSSAYERTTSSSSIP